MILGGSSLVLRNLNWFLDLRRDAVAGLDLLLVQPHAHAVPLQPRGHVAHDCLVLRAVAQENVKLKFIRHI